MRGATKKELFKDLAKLTEIQKVYAEIYEKFTVLEGIDDKSIQIGVQPFFRIFDEYTERERNCKVYPYEYSATYNGVKVICICEERRQK